MTDRIVYRNDEGGMSIIVPSPEALSIYGIEAIAKKDVPPGRPFKIMSASEIPQDRGSRNGWSIPDEELTDGTGGDTDSFV